MSASQDTPSQSFPDDVALCHDMLHGLLQTLAEREDRIRELETLVKQLRSERTRRKSERYIDPHQLQLFDSGDEGASPAVEAALEPEDKSEGKTQKRRGTGRRPFPAHLRREQQLHPLRDDQKACPQCGAVLTIVLVNGSVQWSFRPAEFFGIEHIHEKGFCGCCHEHVVLAEKPPQIIEKGAADASLMAHLTTSKQGDHLPLYRNEEISLRYGWWLPRSTQAGWLHQTSVTALILYAWMSSRLFFGKLLGADATGASVLQPGAGQVQKRTVWVYCGQPEVCPYLVYDYALTAEGEPVRRFLEGYEGYLQADAASVFDQLYLKGTVLEVACAAHMRRYFYQARDSAPAQAQRALACFRQLYRLERELADVSADERGEQRRARALPLLHEFKAWLDEQELLMVPKTEIAKAIRYALNQWEAFERYCDHGWLLIDNTRSERALRPIAIGRSNWLFFGSDSGGRTGAILYSLVASCKSNRVHPYAYLEDVYRRLPVIREDASLLPLLQRACERIEFDDGTRSNLATLQRPLDCLRLLKENPRPLIEVFRDESSALAPAVVDELNALLPDRWLETHPESRLEINRATRIVGEAA